MKAAFTSKQNFENDVAVQLLQIIGTRCTRGI
jgi:hypothetical protein